MPEADAALPALLEALISGLAEDPPWSRFIGLFRDTLTADYASIVFRPFTRETPNPRVVHLFSGANPPPSVSRRYRERLYLQDPLPYDGLDPGRPYSLAELLNDDDPRHRGYRRELLAPSGMNHLRIMRIEDDNRASAWLIASRRERDFPAAADDLFRSLAPYLRAALTARVAQERERTRRDVAGEAMRRMNFGWLTLDATGCILDADTTAEAIMADPGSGLSGYPGGKLVARSIEVRRAIGELLGSTGGTSRCSRVVILSREPWLDLLLVPASFRPGGVRRTPSVVVYIHADRSTTEDHFEHLHSLFDLTPREARLALALSRGKSIAEAADEMNLTIGSARTYSKRIYSKMGARGQNDLIRFMHRSAMALT